MRRVGMSLKNGDIKLLEMPKPICKSKGILIKTLYSAISAGTEKMSVNLGSMNYLDKAKNRPKDVKTVISNVKEQGLLNTYKKVMNKLDEPKLMGYSCLGEVIEVGNDAKEFQTGDIVACFGGGYATHSEVNYIPKNMAVKLSSDKYLRESSLGAIAGIAIEGIKQADIGVGENVAVIGLGLIGQIAIQILKASGCKVIGIEPDKYKRELANECGCDVVLNPDDNMQSVIDFTNGHGVDKVLITAATKSNGPITQAGEIIRDRGIISAIGAVNLDIPRDTYYEKELSLVVSRSYGAGRYDSNYEEKGIDYPIGYVRWTEKRNIQLYIDLLEGGKLQIDKLITHMFDLNQAKEAYNLIVNNQKNENIIGVIFEYEDNLTNKKNKFENIIVLNEQKKYSTVNIGLIGAGSFVQGTILPTMSKISDYSFIGIASSSGVSATNVANKYGFKYSTTDYQRLLKDEDINLIVIATNHNTHAKFVSEALLSGKDVYCEKPLSINEKELEQVVDAVDRSKKRLFVGFNRRFSPPARNIKEIIKNRTSQLMINYIMNAGYIPKEHWINDPEIGGGRIIGEGCHIVDLFKYLTDSPVKSVQRTNISSSSSEIDPNANSNITLTYEDGSIANLVYTSIGGKAFPKETCFIFNQNIVIKLDNYKSITICNNNKCKTIKYKGIQKGFKEEFIALRDSIKEGKEFPIPITDLIETTRLLLK
jgi:predicted dehydrogenase